MFSPLVSFEFVVKDLVSAVDITLNECVNQDRNWRIFSALPRKSFGLPGMLEFGNTQTCACSTSSPIILESTKSVPNAFCCARATFFTTSKYAPTFGMSQTHL